MTREEATRILGVSVDASSDEAVKAWKTLAQQVHPDRSGTDGMFDLLTEAKETLLGEPREPWVPFGFTTETSTRNDDEVGESVWSEGVEPNYSTRGEGLVFGIPRGEYISQVFGRAFSFRLIIAALFAGVLISVMVGAVWDAAREVVALPAAILLWLAYSLNPTSPPPKCPYCRKRVKLSAKACHHCGRTVAMEVDGF